MIKDLWALAKKCGNATFDTGKKCRRGHTSPRWTNSRICIACKRENDIAYNRRNPEAHLARARASAERRPTEVKAYRKTYYRANAEAAKLRAKQWEHAHPERVRERSVAWYAKNASRLRPIAAARRAANPEPAREANRRWKKENKHKVLAADALRRAREVGARAGCRKAYAAFVKWSRTQPKIPCHWCGKETVIGWRHRDHIVPITRGGSDSVENLCIACPPCNMRKSDKLPEEFTGQSELRFA